MAKISPFCDQKAGCLILMGKACHLLDVGIGHIQAVDGLLPTLYPGAEILIGSLCPELLRMVLPGFWGVVPVHADDVLGQLLERLWVGQNDVAPEHGLLSQLLHVAADLADPVHVHLMAAHLIRQGFAPAIDVEALGGKEGQELVNHVIHQGQGILVGHV